MSEPTKTTGAIFNLVDAADAASEFARRTFQKPDGQRPREDVPLAIAALEAATRALEMVRHLGAAPHDRMAADALRQRFMGER